MKTFGELTEITQVSPGGVFAVNNAEDTITNKITIENLKTQIVSATLGETSDTAYRGDRGKIAYDHSQVVTGNPHHITASDIGTYTSTEIDNKISMLESSLTWKPAVATYNDIDTTYPDPSEGWTVVTTDTNIAWRYSGGEWIKISANSIPDATTEIDGLMTSSMVTKLNGIEANAQVNTITGVKGDSESSYRTGNVNITKSDIGLGNVGNFKAVSTVASQELSTEEQTAARNNIGAGTSSLELGNTETTAAAGNHTHTTTLAADSGTSTVNLSANTIYKLTTGGTSVIFKTPTDTTYSSKTAASGGTDVSLVTTGEKYTWNNKSNLALGTTSSTAYRGDYGNAAYVHAVTNKGAAFSSGLYKITTNAEGHVTAATAVAKADITGLGIPESDTNDKVAQTATSTDGAYEVLFSNSANNTTETAGARKDSGLTFNPSTDTLTTKYVSPKVTKALTGSGTAGSDKGSGVSPRYIPTLWTFNAGVTVANGEVYFIKIPAAGGTYGVWLSLNNGTNYYPVAVSSGKARFTTHYGNNTVIAVTYESAGVCTCYAKAGADSTADVTGIFRVLNDYDSGNTNTNVTQTATTGNANYEVLFSVTADNTTRTEGARKNSNLLFNPSTGNLQTTQLNGVTVGSSPKFTDTTYSSKTAASGGTDVSLVTTGEKYTWNNKSTLAIGTTATTAAAGNHTHNYAGSSSAGGAATSLSNFKVTTTSNLGVDAPGTNAVGYVSGLTKADWNYQQTDGALYTQFYSASWLHEIFGDYRTGQIAIRGKNNGTWQSWRRVLDETNYTTWAATKGHTHTLTIAADSGTNALTLAASTKYKITAGGSTFIFTTPPNTTYSSKTAASGGTDVSLVTTGEKYTWNNKSTLAIGTTATTAAAGNHTHSYLPLSGGTMTGRITSAKPNKFLVTGSGTAAQDKGASVSPRYFPAKWTFNTGITAADGDMITIKIPCAGHTYGVFMSIDNGTKYYPVVINGTSRLTTHYGNGTYITVQFESGGSAADMFALAGANARATVTGGVWRVINFYDSNSNTIPSAYCDTAAATAAKTASCSGYSLLSKSFIHVIVVNTNTSASAITLNINGKGAKPIYINGSASSSSNYSLTAGSYLVYYNGTNYYFRTDGKLTADITGNAATVGGVKIGTSNSQYGYWNANNTFVAFKSQADIDSAVAAAKVGNATAAHVLSGKTFTNSTTSGVTGTMVNQGTKTYTINPGGSQTIPAGYHNGSGKVTANPNQNSGTYTPTTRAASIDMGANNTIRYVTTTSVPNSNSGTYTPTTRAANIDMGAANSYRYVTTTSVPNSNSGTCTLTSSETGTKDMGATNTYRYVNAANVYAKGKTDGLVKLGNLNNQGGFLYSNFTTNYPNKTVDDVLVTLNLLDIKAEIFAREAYVYFDAQGSVSISKSINNSTLSVAIGSNGEIRIASVSGAVYVHA